MGLEVMDFWKKLEIFTKLGELLIKYQKLILFLIGLIPTGAYSAFSYFQVEAKEATIKAAQKQVETQESTIKATQKQVAQVAEAYQAAYVTPEKKQPVIIKSNCDCAAAIKRHEKLIHLIR